MTWITKTNIQSHWYISSLDLGWEIKFSHSNSITFNPPNKLWKGSKFVLLEIEPANFLGNKLLNSSRLYHLLGSGFFFQFPKKNKREISIGKFSLPVLWCFFPSFPSLSIIFLGVPSFLLPCVFVLISIYSCNTACNKQFHTSHTYIRCICHYDHWMMKTFFLSLLAFKFKCYKLYHLGSNHS